MKATKPSRKNVTAGALIATKNLRRVVALNSHGKARSLNKDLRSRLGIRLASSRAEGRTLTNCT